MELIYFLSCFGECSFACGRNLVDSSAPAIDPIDKGSEEPCSFQAMEERVECSGADAVAVMCQFLHHLQPEDRLMRCMEQHVNAYEAVEEFPLVAGHRINISPIGHRLDYYRISI